MQHDTPQSAYSLPHMSDEELIRKFRVSADPLVQELIGRLTQALDRPKNIIEKLKKVADELERLHDEQEKRIVALENQISRAA